VSRNGFSSKVTRRENKKNGGKDWIWSPKADPKPIEKNVNATTELIKKLEDSDKNNLIKIDYKPPGETPEKLSSDEPTQDTVWNNTLTRMMHRNPRKTAFITASTIASVTFTAKAVVVGLSAIGIASPVGPGIAVALLIANELAKIYQANQNLLLVMQDMTIILSNIYKLNNLIDKSSKVFFIYMLQSQGEEQVRVTVDVANVFKTIKSEIEQIPADNKLDNINARITNMLSKNKSDNASIATITPKETLFGQIRKDPDIQSRLYDKIQYLIVYLFDLSPTKTLQTLYSDASVRNSGIGRLLETEFQKRGVVNTTGEKDTKIANFQKAPGTTMFNIAKSATTMANRAYMRTMEGKTVTNKMVQDLCIINGYFSLMKSQYDFEWDYYARMLKKEEYDRIWSVIQAQQEYKDFMVKENMDDLTKQIFAEERNNLNLIKNDVLAVATTENNPKQDSSGKSDT
jgi:hypothetical protein